MKKCSHCGRAYSDFVTICSYCGAPLDGGNAQPKNPQYSAPTQQPIPPRQTQSQQAYSQPAYSQPVNPQPTYVPPVYAQPQTRENVLLGIIGAILFSSAGIILQVVITSLGRLAAIVGIAMYYLAQLGYQKFSGSGTQISKTGKIICIVISVLMLAFAVTVSTFSQLFLAYRQAGMNLDTVQAVYLFENDPAVKDVFVQNLGASYALWGVSILLSKFDKKKKKA